MSKSSRPGFATRAVHAGEPRGTFGPDGAIPSVNGIQPSTTYHYESADTLEAIFRGEREGWVYSRYGSPTLEALERAVSELEEGLGAVAFASGMGAIHAALLAALDLPGPTPTAQPQPARLAVAAEAYGSTRAIADRVFGRLGVEVRIVDANDLASVELGLGERGGVGDKAPVQALLVEAISNPCVRVADLDALAQAAHRAGALLLVDSTFATPYLWRPLEHGADVVVHSGTKFMGGHGDATLGLVVAGGRTARQFLAATRTALRLCGGVASPFDAFLVHRGLKTLPLRMARQSQSALELAQRLVEHPRVSRVLYPGLKNHPDHALCARLSEGRGAGGVLSFEIRNGTLASGKAFLDALGLCLPATSLGDAVSLALVPVMSSHREVPEADRARLGISDGLVRLSVGLEDPGDLYLDLERALAA